jgi:pyridoxal biosynthesis lyase PdxS
LQSIVVAAQARAAEAAGACAVLQKMAKNLGKTRPVSLIQESQNDPKVKNNMGFSLLNG